MIVIHCVLVPAFLPDGWLCRAEEWLDPITRERLYYCLNLFQAVGGEIYYVRNFVDGDWGSLCHRWACWYVGLVGLRGSAYNLA